MKTIFFLLLCISLFSISCYTTISCIERHPENYINQTVKVKGIVEDWLYDYHGYYFIVLTNRYNTKKLLVYKQMPNLWYHQRIKVEGKIIKAKIQNNVVLVLIDTNNYSYKIKTNKNKYIVEYLSFRDSLPTTLWFNNKVRTQNNFSP